MKEEKERLSKAKQLERITFVYRHKLKMVSNLYEQIEERKEWIKILNEDIDDHLKAMEELE